MLKFIKTFCYQANDKQGLKDIIIVLLLALKMSDILLYDIIGFETAVEYISLALTIFSPIAVILIGHVGLFLMAYLLLVAGFYIVNKLTKIDEKLKANECIGIKDVIK